MGEPVLKYTPPAPLLSPEPSNLILGLDLSRISLCNEGMNSRAHILMTKGKEAHNMTFDEIMAGLQPEAANIVKAHIAAKDTEASTAVATLAETTKELTLLKSKVPAIPPVTPAEPSLSEALAKAAPEVQAQFKAMQETVENLVKAQQEALTNERYTALKALPNVTADELKPLLKSMSPAVYDVLCKAAAAVEKTVLGDSRGNNVGNASSTDTSAEFYNQLMTKAQDIKKASPALTIEAAFENACVGNPELYGKYNMAVRGGK